VYLYPQPQVVGNQSRKTEKAAIPEQEVEKEPSFNVRFMEDNEIVWETRQFNVNCKNVFNQGGDNDFQ
jgi:hypothetical protein